MSASTGPRLVGLGHVTVRSADFERTERFYGDLLGLRTGPRPQIGIPGRWMYIDDNAVLHVLPRAAGGAAAAGTIDHFALVAADRGAFEARLRAAGQPFQSVRLPGTEVWQIFVTDPDGARVELSFPQEPA